MGRPKVYRVPNWKIDRIVQLYFEECLPKHTIIERLGVSHSVILRVIRDYEKDTTQTAVRA